MSSKLLSNLFWFLALSCLWLMFKSKFDESNIQYDSNDSTSVTGDLNDDIKDISDQMEESSRHSSPGSIAKRQAYERFPLFYTAYNKIKQQPDDTSQLIAIKKALIIATQEGFSNKKILRNLHISAANIHESKWHFVYAVDSFNQAQSLIYNKRVARQISRLREHLSRAEVERSLNDDYITTKGTGPAKEFKGKILVAYVFVDDGIKTRWSNKTKQRSLQIMSQVQHWQREKAKIFNINNIEFINKTFVARRNPRFKTVNNVTFKSSATDIAMFVDSIAESLGEKSIGDFIEKQIKVSGAEQGVVYLHTNIEQRSFAQRCAYTHQRKFYSNGQYKTEMFSDCKNEYVMLMEKVKRNRWDKMHYTQAHEMMHVFGAADLYNIKNASHYAVTDIMNLQSKRLIDASIEPITAFAIGWTNVVPPTPFKVIER